MILYLMLIMALASQPKTDIIYICPDKPPHSCNWFDCRLEGQYVFDDTADDKYPYNNSHNQGSYNYWFDKTHFENPTLTVDEVRKKLEKALSTVTL